MDRERVELYSIWLREGYPLDILDYRNNIWFHITYNGSSFKIVYTEKDGEITTRHRRGIVPFLLSLLPSTARWGRKVVRTRRPLL